MSDRSNQREEAYRRLRPLLLHGQIHPGTRLRETHWAERLGVHRSALREVFGLLAHEGLLEAGERGGHFVPALERADFDEILELRVILETGAIRRLARHDEPPDVAPLRETCDTMLRMIDAELPLGFIEADRRFHEQVIGLAANRRVTRAYLHAPVMIQATYDTIDDARRITMQRTTDEHRAVCDALERSAFEEAASTLEAHLLSAHSRPATLLPMD